MVIITKSEKDTMKNLVKLCLIFWDKLGKIHLGYLLTKEKVLQRQIFNNLL